MQPLSITESEHGIVMSHPGADRIPEAVAYARRLGMRSQHYGWPGVTRTLEGDILVSASERVQHVDPYGREVIARSTDGGRTWGEPQVIFDSISDDRDHALNTLPDGTIVSTWFTSMAWAHPDRLQPEWRDKLAALNPDTLQALSRGWLRRSHDGGRTWEEKVYPTIVGQHAGPNVMSNGDLVYCGPYRDESGPSLVATKSTDGGRAWAITGEIPCPTVRNDRTGDLSTLLNESHALEIEPEHILCVFRGSSGRYNIRFTRSYDGGRTWSEPEEIGVHGYPSYLVRLQAGPILCVFGDRRPPRAIRGLLSYDEGVSWDSARVLTIREFAYKADMGYPVALECAPNEILCVYYSVPGPECEGYESLDPREAGILSTRFRLA